MYTTHYSVMVCDFRSRCDREVARRVNRRNAWKLVRQLNADAMALAGLAAPLYYCLRRTAKGPRGQRAKSK